MKISTHPLETLPSSFASLLKDWRNSEAVRSQMLCQEEISDTAHMTWYKKVISPESSYRVRVVFGDDAPFGVIYLTDIDRYAASASWGMYIGEADFRGRGLGMRMLTELLLWGFEELDLFRMYTSVLDGNERALNIYAKAGFRVEGTWRKHVLCADGQRRDLIWIGMFQEEWKKSIKFQ